MEDQPSARISNIGDEMTDLELIVITHLSPIAKDVARYKNLGWDFNTIGICLGMLPEKAQVIYAVATGLRNVE